MNNKEYKLVWSDEFDEPQMNISFTPRRPKIHILKTAAL